MEKVTNLLKDFGIKVTGAQEVGPYTVKVYFLEGVNDFFTKYFFVGPKGNQVSKHNGKYVLSVIPVSVGYHTGKLIEKDSHFLFKPLPNTLDVDGAIYKLEYKKDVWGF